jgi:hypothetical protein
VDTGVTKRYSSKPSPDEIDGDPAPIDWTETRLPGVAEYRNTLEL